MSWLSGWTYRKEITLSRASGTVTNYQMKLLVGESAGATGEDVDCNSHIQTDFDDLRFTAADGTTLLDYWIESITDATPNQLATVWIEFDSIATTATTFYMYYGKTDAAAVSNGVNTFGAGRFDDFEWSHDGDAITENGGGITWTKTTGAVTISTDQPYGGTRGVESVNNAVQNDWQCPTPAAPHSGVSAYALQCRVYKPDATLSHGFIHGNGTDCLQVYYFTDEQIGYYDTATHYVGTFAADAHHLIEICNINWTAKTFDIWVDGTCVKTGAVMRPLTSYNDIWRWQANANSGSFYVDNVVIRNWANPEPTYGAWGEETTEDVTVDLGLQSGSKSLFSVSENTDQVLIQNLVSKAGSLLSPSFVLDHILIQNLQSGNKTIFSASNITDQILSQNLLASITSVLSVLVSLDQDVSVNVIPVAGSLYEVTVDTGAVGIIVNVGLLLAIGSALESSLQTDQILSQGIIEKLGSVFASSQNTDQILQQNMIAALGAILSSSQSVDRTVQLNALSALASIYQILVQILAAPEKFGYLNLKLELPPALPEGSFAYEHSSLKVIDEGLEGSFNFEHLKTTVEQNLLGWFVMPWFSDWFGEEAGFQFEHQRLMKSAPVEGANFKFENLKSITPSVILNDDFKYKRV